MHVCTCDTARPLSAKTCVTQKQCNIQSSCEHSNTWRRERIRHRGHLACSDLVAPSFLTHLWCASYVERKKTRKTVSRSTLNCYDHHTQLIRYHMRRLYFHSKASEFIHISGVLGSTHSRVSTLSMLWSSLRTPFLTDKLMQIKFCLYLLSIT